MAVIVYCDNCRGDSGIIITHNNANDFRIENGVLIVFFVKPGVRLTDIAAYNAGDWTRVENTEED